MENKNLIEAGKNLNTAVVLLLIGVFMQSGAFYANDDQTLFSSLIFVGVLFQLVGIVYVIFCGQSLIKAGKG